MTENGNRYALAALKERRASIDGEIKECERRLRYLREAIRHVDATLSLFDPEGNPKAITAKRRYKRAKLFGAGNLGRLVLDALRRGGRPMSVAEIVVDIVAALGYGPDAAKGMSQRVRSTLLYQTKVKGLLRKDGDGTSAKWTLV